MSWLYRNTKGQCGADQAAMYEVLGWTTVRAGLQQDTTEHLPLRAYRDVTVTYPFVRLLTE